MLTFQRRRAAALQACQLAIAGSARPVSSGLPASSPSASTSCGRRPAPPPRSAARREILGVLQAAGDPSSRASCPAQLPRPRMPAIAPSGAGQDADGIERHVTEQLEPDIRPKIRHPGHFSPPAAIAWLNADSARDRRSGSPIENRVPSMCRMTPARRSRPSGKRRTDRRLGGSRRHRAARIDRLDPPPRVRPRHDRGSTTTESRSAPRRRRCPAAATARQRRRSGSCTPSARGRRCRRADRGRVISGVRIRVEVGAV